MKILAISDRPPSESIIYLVEKNNIDLICTMGDLDFFQIQELMKITTIPKIGVYGNHCSGNYFEPLGITNLHLQVFEFQGVKFGGFEGSLRYKKSEYAKMYSQEEAQAFLKDFPSVDVMIAHSPPLGINDEPGSTSHAGFLALKEYLDHCQPKYFFHGHTYPTQDNLVTKYGETNVVYVFGEKIIEI